MARRISWGSPRTLSLWAVFARVVITAVNVLFMSIMWTLLVQNAFLGFILGVGQAGISIFVFTKISLWIEKE
jgi:hypothetical protein